MPWVQPLFLPRPVIEERRLVLENDFGVEHHHFAFGPEGRLFVVSSLFYNYYRYDNKNDGDFSTLLVNVYGPELRPERLAEFSRLTAQLQEGGGWDFDYSEPSLAVLPDGTAALTTRTNRTFLYRSDLGQQLGAFAKYDADNRGPMIEGNFAYQIEPTPDGRLLCLVSEPGVRLVRFDPNLICLSDGSPLTPQHRPQLTCLACLETKIADQGAFPYVRLLDGQPAGGGRGPKPSLVDRSKEMFHTWIYEGWLGQALPLDAKHCVVSVFHRLMRGGTKGSDFLFALVDYDGQLTGRLEGIDPHADSPYVDHHYRLAVDRAHQRIYYKSKATFFAFDYEGRMLSRIKLDAQPLKTLSPMKLGCCSPQGEIILHHPKQHLVLMTDPAEQPDRLEETLTCAATAYKKETTRLRKQHQPTNHRWLYRGEVIRH